MDKSSTKDKIKILIDKYLAAKQAGQLIKYSEEDTKKDFIMPLFESLGWNVTDRREVTAEESQSNGRVDYGFYLEGRIKFYLEAKPIKADLHREDYAKQAIRYSWNKGVSWAVLTDFETLKVFYCQDPTQSLFSKQLFNINIDEYLDRINDLWYLSREAFETDSVDSYAERIGKKMQKILVGDQLYKHLDECRKILIEKLGAWNGIKDQKLLDEGVQKLLDRLIFIRVAEDRGIEDAILIPLLREWENNKKGKSLYESMIGKFRELDSIYNSNLFTEHPFEKWNESPGVTEKVIETFQGKASYYEYDFKVMPADVLGAVYENYLGHRLAQSQKGLILDKNAKKRKEQGIYYTPSFIVDYIVRNALQPVLDKCRSINDLQRIKVLDPACGSGSFLIKVLEVINEKYKEFGNPANEFTKIMILQQNIYGVDLDDQAVEITRLNLLLSSLETRMKLPRLDKNIKNGNSLISGSDEELQKYFGKNFRDRKPFNWEEEFPEVFKQGGFDVIIGNPPYVRIDSLESHNKIFWKEYYKAAQGKYDLYYLFIEKSLSLLKENGNLGFIIPNKFCVSDSGKSLREIIFKSAKFTRFLSISRINVFKDASNYPVILFAEREKTGEEIREVGYAQTEEEICSGKFPIFKINQKDFSLLPQGLIPINVNEEQFRLVISLIERCDKLENFLNISEGLRIPLEDESKEKKEFRIVKQYQFSRYSGVKKGTYIDENSLLKILNKESGRFKNSQMYKIIIAEDALQITATLDQDKHIPQGGVYFGTTQNQDISMKYLLGLLNSKLLSFVYKTLYGGMHMGGGYLRFRTNFLNYLPIVKLVDRRVIEKITYLVGKMIELHEIFPNSPENSNEWRSLVTEIEKVDKIIDEEVYKLYGLTTEEIEIVEKN